MTEFERVSADVTVVGGGMAGVCAAIAAARTGAETTLINDRPVLGGNASSEVRVWVNGATGGRHNRYSREGGIVEELMLKNKYMNPGGSADLWDAVLQDTVTEQSNLSLYLNTLVTDIETEGDRILAAEAHQNMSERHFRFESSQFVDATGDGVLAAEAGAEWVQGREATDRYGEAAAPDSPDEKTLGSSIMFYSKEVDHEVAYEPPNFAHDFSEDTPEIVAKRTNPQQRKLCFWWVEYGGQDDLDPISDNEAIRDELSAIVYGVWDYIKNSGEFPEDEVGNLQLEWVGKIPGKRESRRVLGDTVVTEDDILSQRRFEDAIGHGGWSIDLHPPSGIYDDQGKGSMHYHANGPYSIPYRSLYAKDLENVFLAGRHMSASHIAFGTLRVQATLAVGGQAVGTAAALCERTDDSPRELAENDIDALQQTLLRDDQWIIDEANRDPSDHARDAEVTASSTQSASITDARTTTTLTERDMGLHFAFDGYLETIELLLQADSPSEEGETAELTVELYTESRPENTIPDERHRRESVSVPTETADWVEIPVELDVGEGQGVFVVLRSPDGIEIQSQKRELSGIMALPRYDNATGGHPGLTPEDAFWGNNQKHATTPEEWVPCVRFTPEPALYAPENVTDGYSRPYGLGHSWLSEPFEAGAPDSEWIELSWETPRTVSCVQLVTNTHLNEWFNNLGEEAQTEAETVRDYRIEIQRDGDWTTVVSEAGNWQRFRRHTFEPVETDRLRIVVEATNGARAAELFETRVYGPDHELPLEEL